MQKEGLLGGAKSAGPENHGRKWGPRTAPGAAGVGAGQSGGCRSRPNKTKCGLEPERRQHGGKASHLKGCMEVKSRNSENK